MELDQGTQLTPGQMFEELQRLRHELQEHHRATTAALQESIHAEVTALRDQYAAQIQQIRTEIATAGAVTDARLNDVLLAGPGGGPTTPRRKPMPSPAVFEGDRARFLSWRLEIEHKLTVDAEFIGGPREQWGLLWNCLSPTVQKKLRYFFSTGDQVNYNVTNFLERLRDLYQDEDTAAKARAEFAILRMGAKESFHSFYIRFETLLHESGQASYNEQVKVDLFRHRLSDRIRETALTATIDESSLKTAVEGYRRVAVSLENWDREKNANRYLPPAPGNKTTMPTPGPDSEGDSPMTGVNALKTKGSGKGKSRSDNGPAAEGDTRRKAAWVTPTEITRRSREKLCFRCGSADHRIGGCTLAPAERPKEQTSIRAADTAPSTQDDPAPETVEGNE
jgi:hypothetical protein